MIRVSNVRQKSVSLESLDSDFEDTFFDARESNSETNSPRKTVTRDNSMIAVCSRTEESTASHLREMSEKRASVVVSDVFGVSSSCLHDNYSDCDTSEPPPQAHVSCVRSLSDVSAKTADESRVRKNSSKSGSNSSSRESVSITSVSHFLLPPRNALHKSISTPVLVGQECSEDNIVVGHDKLDVTVWDCSQSDEESHDSIESSLIELRERHFSNSHLSLEERFRDSVSVDVTQESDEDRSSKPKKRGSLFFRRRKSKKEEKESKKSPHQFVTVCYSTAALCDVCKKALANKSAVKCEICLVTVHDSSCKDQILDCNKFRQMKKPNELLLTAKDRSFALSLQVPADPLHYPIRYRRFFESYAMARSCSQFGLNQKTPSPTSAQKVLQSPQSSTFSLDSTASSPRKGSSPNLIRKSYTPSGYSQWHRVATKLGVKRVISEDRELETPDDGYLNIAEVNSTSLESLHEEVFQEIPDLEEPSLRLMEEEPEAWSSVVDKKILTTLEGKEIKRQEVIYGMFLDSLYRESECFAFEELIITEKHHCLTLKIMHKVFAEGMLREVLLTKDMVERIFPCLEELLELHTNFLHKLRERQQQETVVENIGDIILQQFTGDNAKRMQLCYSHFCSHHKNALLYYKDILKSDRRFQAFVKKYSSKPLCKARGIPECILLVTQRVTKYPLLIDSLIKASKDSVDESKDLQESLFSVKDILNKINAKVDEKERENRLIQIYNKIDAKSAAVFNGNKFKKSDVLSKNRKLRFESVMSWKSARGKTLDVITIILSDIIIFLQESNQKYYFASQDNKSGIIPLQRLLVRPKAGDYSKGIYLISPKSFPEPEMYELICLTSKEQEIWVSAVRQAIDSCPDEEESISPVCEPPKVEEETFIKLSDILNSVCEDDTKLTQLCDDKVKISIQS